MRVPVMLLTLLLALVACGPVTAVPTSTPTPTPLPGERYAVDAPIDEAQVVRTGEGWAVRVVSGLPSGCARYAGYQMDASHLETERLVRLRITNSLPRGEVACTAIYGMVEALYPLPLTLTPGTPVTVDVNGTRVVFTP
jgi:hypothetical protein